MKTCSDYVAEAKARLGNPRMSDREFGEHLEGYSQTAIASGKHGKMSDPMAVRVAALLGIPAGELLMVARLEREKDPAIRAALTEWAGNVFSLMPTKAARSEIVRGGVRAANTARQNRFILPHCFVPSARPMVSGWTLNRAAIARCVNPRAFNAATCRN